MIKLEVPRPRHMIHASVHMIPVSVILYISMAPHYVLLYFVHFRARGHGGIRIQWGKEEDLYFDQKWNPFCKVIPYATFAHHKLIYNPKETETVTYNVDDFYESLIQGINIFNRNKGTGKTIQTIEGPIVIESYASLASLIFNQSPFGYNRDRNGISF